MRVLYVPPNKTTRIPYLQKGGELPGVQYGSGFFGNLVIGLKRIALPALKAVGKAALPMAKEALMAGLASDGSVKERLKAAGQTALTRKNLVGLTKAGSRALRRNVDSTNRNKQRVVRPF